MIARDFIVPDAPNIAICRLSLVSLGIQTALPSYSPKITPSALPGVVTSRRLFISFSVIHDAVPYAPDLLFVKPRGSCSLPPNLSFSLIYAKSAPPANRIPAIPFRPSGVNAIRIQTSGFQSNEIIFTPLSIPPDAFHAA